MNTRFPCRKRNRLEGFDYSSGHAYFITICTKDKKCIFGRVCTGAETEIMELSEAGKLANEGICAIPTIYKNVSLVNHCVMPNHVHILLKLEPDFVSPSVSTVINQYKGAVSRRLGKSVWQKSFYDHVIRNEEDFQCIWQYIQYNPAKWRTDGYYVCEKG